MLNPNLIAQPYSNTYQLNGNNNASINAIDADANGNIYTVGNFRGSVDLDFGTGSQISNSPNNNSIFIQKLDNSGNLSWAKTIQGPVNVRQEGIKVDALGSVYLVGSFSGTVDFDPSGLVANLSSTGQFTEAFVLKLNAQGNYLWVKRFGNMNDEEINAIGIDRQNDVYLTGKYKGTVDFDPSSAVFNLTSSPNKESTFIVKLNPSGNFIWAKSFIGSDYNFPSSIAIDHKDNLVVVGVFGGSIDFDPGSGSFPLASQTTSGGSCFFVKLTKNGNFRWAKQVGGGNGSFTTSLAIDAQNNNYIAGSYFGSLDFNPGIGVDSLYNSGSNSSVFILKLDSIGDYSNAIKIGGTRGTIARQINLDQNGYVYQIGNFFDTLTLNQSNPSNYVVSNGSADVYVVSLNQDLIFQSGYSIGGTFSDNGTGILPTTTNEVYTSGNFIRTVDFDFTNSIDTLTATIVDGFLSKFIHCNFDTSLSLNGSTLTSNHVATSNSTIQYQWLNCSNGFAVIPNETNPSFTATQNGNYALEISNGSCRDTSSCFFLLSVGIQENLNITEFIVFPNPVTDHFYISNPRPTQAYTYSIYNSLGNQILNAESSEHKLKISLKGASGIYFLKIDQGKQSKTFKVLKSEQVR